MQCEDLKNKVGEIASRFHARPSSKMNVIGVTGTDGKTSIAHFLAQCLDDNDVHCGVMGTLGNGFINDLHPTGLTTVDALQTQQTLADICDAGAKHVVMEVSSHGLDQGRVSGVVFDTAVFSNMSRDHMDYHATKDDYAQAKKKLFFMPGLKTAVINLDDEFGKELANECKQNLSLWGYSTAANISELVSYADNIVHAKKIETTKHGLEILVDTPKGECQINVGLLGRFNVSNILAVFATLLVSGIKFENAVRRIQSVHPVSGRMEIISVPDKPVIVVDYAHTPKGLEAACSSVREHFDGEFWCVFGCGGDRDRGKRPLMARVVEQYADHIIVSSDNPRHENPQKIIDEIMQGFSSSEKVQQSIDRREAIESVVKQAKPDDVIMLAGKGHETSQIIGDVNIAFDDLRVARECLGAPL